MLADKGAGLQFSMCLMSISPVGGSKILGHSIMKLSLNGQENAFLQREAARGKGCA